MNEPSGRSGRKKLEDRASERESTARRKADELARAQAALAARDSVLAVVSHDLRDPLNAIVTSVAVLEESCPANGPTRRAVQTIRRSTDQMSRLIRDLLDAARLEDGRLSIEPEEVPVAEILDEVHQMFLPRARDRSLRLARETSAEAERSSVLADRARLVQVISNLLSNAVRMTPRGGTIRLGAELAPRPPGARRAAGPPTAVRFYVADTGPGLDPAQVPHLFQPFWQARRSTGGSGLGLAIARGIVEAHGSEIRVETGGDEAGAAFSFEIPRV
jgi:signal transduction histidine kinase